MMLSFPEFIHISLEYGDAAAFPVSRCLALPFGDQHSVWQWQMDAKRRAFTIAYPVAGARRAHVHGHPLPREQARQAWYRITGGT
jgi:hypothetical protein